MRRVYYNGTIITMEEDIYADYVVTENGIIKETGRGSAPEADEYVDLKGNTLMPSFIDPHSHMTSVAYSFLRVQLDEITSIKEIKEKIEKFIVSGNKQNQWVVAMGYDNNILEEKRHITHKDLDEISGGCAIIVEHKSGHSGVFNMEAQKRLGITSSVNGLMEETPYLEKLKEIPLEEGQALMDAYKKAQDKYFSYGITTAQEGYGLGMLLPLYKGLMEAGILKIDLVAYPDFDSIEKWYSAFPKSRDKYDRSFKIGGLKIMLDGSPQGKTAWISGTYTDGTCGYPALSDEEVNKAVSWAAENNVQVISHCNGNMACEQFIDAVGRYRNNRAVIIHAQLLRKDQLDKVKEYEMIPSFFVAHTFHWGDTHIKNFGLERAKTISPANSALKKGILFTFHQDAPVIEQDMFETVWCAVKRQTKDGVILGEDERISVLEALKAVTVNAAYQYFEEGTKGVIKEGAKENLIVVDKDPLKAEIDDIKNIKILKTIKDGNTVYSA